MSRGNVETFKRAIEAGNCRDIDALLAEFDPDVEYHAVLPLLAGETVYRGHEGVRAFLREVWESFGDARFDSEKILDTDAGLVALGRWRGHGQASGAETEMPFGYESNSKPAR